MRTYYNNFPAFQFFHSVSLGLYLSVVLLNSSSILFDSLLSTAQSFFFFFIHILHITLLRGLIPLSNCIFCAVDPSIIPLYLKSLISSSHSKVSLLLQRPCLSVFLHSASLTASSFLWDRHHSCPFLLRLLILVLVCLSSFSMQDDFIHVLTSYHSSDTNTYDPWVNDG